MRGMEKPAIPTPQETIKAILARSGRDAVPIRRLFLQAAADTSSSPPPLSKIVHAHDARALDLYLLILAQASSGEFDVTHPAAVWARALGMPSGKKPGGVSKVLSRLLSYGLISRNRVRRLAHITLLMENGSGEPYTRPGARGNYLQLPHAYWLDSWHLKLSLPAKVALLIARSLPPNFFLYPEASPKQFRLSPDTVSRGLHELLNTHSLLKRSTDFKQDPLTTLGYRAEFRYNLQPPFNKPLRDPASNTAGPPLSPDTEDAL